MLGGDALSKTNPTKDKLTNWAVVQILAVNVEQSQKKVTLETL
jgi:hypothetical protein